MRPAFGDEHGPPRGDASGVKPPKASPITINAHVEVHVHFHSAEGAPPASDIGTILAALREVENTMSKVLAALAAQSSADDALAAEITALVAVVQGFAAQEASDLQKALAAAGVDDDANAAIVDASTARIKAFADQIAAALPSATPAPGPVTVTPLSISGAAGSPVTGQLSATGGTGPYTFAASDNPGDINVASDGTISGTPQSAEAGNFDVTATDSTGANSEPASIPYSIT